MLATGTSNHTFDIRFYYTSLYMNVFYWILFNHMIEDNSLFVH